MVAMKESMRKNVTRRPLTKPTSSDAMRISAAATGHASPWLNLQADAQHLRETEVVADRKVELLGGERHHGGERQNGRHGLADENTLRLVALKKLEGRRRPKTSMIRRKTNRSP